MAERGASGFTLVETLIALVLSSFILILVSHAFLVQNEFYSTQTLRTGVQDNVRAATELVAREIRNTVKDGVLVAGPRTLTLRSPVVMAMICNRATGTVSDVQSDGGEAALDTDEIAGLALLDDSIWVFANSTWAEMNGSDLSSASNCAANGADTAGAAGDFHRLDSIAPLITGATSDGDVLMLFRETTFKIQQSELDPSTFGLFRAAYGDSLAEFATGVDTTAQFQYRTGGATYSDTVVAASLGTIDAVRIISNARRRAATGGRGDVTFGWAVNVPLRGIR